MRKESQLSAQTATPAAIVLGLALAGIVLASDEAPEQEPGETADRAVESVESASVELPIYQPPTRGKPRERVGGAVRGAIRQWPRLTALVPEHPGQTISARPSFFWYLDALPPPETPLMFALIREERIDPLIEVELARPTEPGIQRIDLAPLGFELRPGVEYQWSVALVVDASERANDIVTVGYIDRVDAPEGDDLRTPGALASGGFWYDALAAVDDWIRDEPDSPAALQARAGLLGQAGLEVAIGDPNSRGDQKSPPEV